MADVATNRGAYLFQLRKFRNSWQTNAGANRGVPTNYFLALCTAASPMSKDINLLSQLTQVSGGGYPPGGYAVPVSSAGFPTIAEDDTLDKSVAHMADVTITAVGSDIPAFGWVVLTDDEPLANRQVLGAFEVVPPVSIPNGTTKVLQDGKLEDAPV
jgi:hypothetical protein